MTPRSRNHVPRARGKRRNHISSLPPVRLPDAERETIFRIGVTMLAQKGYLKAALERKFGAYSAIAGDRAVSEEEYIKAADRFFQAEAGFRLDYQRLLESGRAKSGRYSSMSNEVFITFAPQAR